MKHFFWGALWLFHDGGPYHIETIPLICRANQWNGFYMIGTSVMKELMCWFPVVTRFSCYIPASWVAKQLLIFNILWFDFQRALRAYVLTCQRALCAYVLMCQRALHAYVLTCQRALRALVLTCQPVLSAYMSHVSTCLACLCTHVSTSFAISLAYVQTCLESLTWQDLNDHVITCQHALPPL